MKKGKVYLIGSGPSGKDLITVKALQILRQADAVIYDYLVDKELLSETSPDAELICCEKLGKHQNEGTTVDSQRKINTLMVSLANKGKNIARLKNGDPLIFGRAFEEMKSLKENRIEFEVVPGITAAQAAASIFGIPLTERGISSNVVFVTGHEAFAKKKSNIDWKSISGCATIVLYMSVKNIPQISEELMKAGRPASTPAAVVSNAGRINQKLFITSLGNISETVRKGEVVAPAVFVIGETVAIRKKFNLLEKNRRILFTGFSQKRFFLKGDYFHQPMIKIERLDDYTEFDKHLKRIKHFQWLVFTSRYSVEYFFERLNRAGFDARTLQGIKIAAIGNSTAGKLGGFGIRADLTPKDESSGGLLAAFKRADIENKNIFLPRSDISDKGLAQGLRNLGGNVTACVAYRNVMPEYLPDFDISSFNEIMFTSPSGVRNFVKRYGRPPKKVQIKCIGGVTRAQAKKLKLL